jgi:hypothetical protein
MNAVTESHIQRIQAPAELRDLPGWLMWKFVHVPGEKKPRKVPYYVDGGVRRGQQGSPNDRRRLVTLSVAKAVASRRGFDGIGLALMPEWGFTALDFDDCIVEGQLMPEVESLVVGTYAEFSPSGLGVRAIVRASGLGDRKDKRAGTFGFEVFSGKGFVTFTGDALPVCQLLECEDTIAEASPAIRALCLARFGEERERHQSEAVAAGLLTLAQMRLALSGLDAGQARAGWLRAGMALHHDSGGSDEALNLWDEWSAGAANYPGRERLEYEWASFDRGFQGPPVTALTLVSMARQQGGVHVEINPVDPDELTPIAETTGAAPGVAAGLYYAYDLERPKPIEFVTDGFLPVGLTVFAGAPGVGKTSLLVPMAAITAHLIESPLRPTLRRKVVIISEQPEQVQGVLYALAKHAKGARREEFTEWLRIVPARRLKPAQLRKLLARLTEENTVEQNGYPVKPLIILDTANACIDLENENDNSQVGAACAAIREGIGPAGACWVVHHAPKAQRGASVEDLTIRGGSAWEGDASTTAYISTEGTEDKRFVRLGKCRFAPRYNELAFDTDVDTEVVQAPWGETQEIVLRYGVPEGSSAAVRREQAQTAKASKVAQEEKALDAEVLRVFEEGGAMTKKSASGSVKVKRDRVYAAVDRLVGTGKLLPVGASERGGGILFDIDRQGLFPQNFAEINSELL